MASVETPRLVSLVPSLSGSKRNTTEAASETESDSDSSHEVSGSRRRKGRTTKKTKSSRRRASEQLVAEKVSLNDTDPRKILYAINPDYALVRAWVQKNNSSGHSRMADPDSDEDTLYDGSKDILFMRLDTVISQREQEEQENRLTIERRNATNYTFLRYVMSNRDASHQGDRLLSSAEAIKLREQQRCQSYFSKRSWEESYMREPDTSKGEQPCVKGEDCIGKKIEKSGGGFVLVAYYFEPEVIAHKRENKALPQNRMCIFCLRKETLKHFVDACADQRQFDSDTIVQWHRNSALEYHPDYMIRDDKSMRKGLADPIVIQTTSSTHYRLVEENGKKRYNQLIPRPTKQQQQRFLM